MNIKIFETKLYFIVDILYYVILCRYDILDKRFLNKNTRKSN